MKNDEFNLDQDEYQFKDEFEEMKPREESSEISEEQSPLLNNMPKAVKSSKMRRLLFPVGLIIVIFIVYNFLNWYSAKKSQSGAKQEQAIAKKQMQTAKPSAVSVAAPVQRSEVIPASASAVQALPMPAANQQMDLLTKQGALNREQLMALGDKMQQNQEALLDLNKRLEDLTASVQNLQTELLKYYERLAKPKKPKKVVKKKPIPLYRVHAIVPNRAWLESSDGDNVTVKIGDKIDGYGVVEIISPRQGMVVTSTGHIIQYGVNDF